MGYSFLPPNTQILFEQTLDTNAFQLIGTVPSQYPTGITVYVMNYEERNTIQCQCIITRHRTANDANVFNKTMYIPPNNMAKFTNFSNIAGLNVFLKTSGTKCVALITQSNELANGNQFINATPTVINQDQSIVPMPAPKMVNANSTDTQLLQLRGLINNLTQQSSTLNTSFSQQYQILTNKLGVLELAISSISETSTTTSSPELSGLIASITSLSNIANDTEESIAFLEANNNNLSSSIESLSSNIDNLINSSQLSTYLSSQIDNNKNQIENISISISEINNDINTLTSDLFKLSESVDLDFTDIENIYSITGNLSDSIESLDERFNSFSEDTIASLSGINDSEIISLSDNISYLSSQIDSLSSQFLNTIPINSDGVVTTSVINGENGGTITITDIRMGTYKKILLTFNNYQNNSGDNQYITYSTPFTVSPVVISTINNLAIKSAIDNFTIASSPYNSVYNGTIIIEGI